MKNALKTVFALSVVGFGSLFGNTVSASAPTANEVAKLVAVDGAAGDLFGFSVAVDGDTAVIGASNDGSAYVFTRSGGQWNLQQKLSASYSAALFGTSVAVDGDTVVIGARNESYSLPPPAPTFNYRYSAGAAYVFTRSDTTWTEQAKLTASDGAYYDRFGYSVAIDGETAVVGAYDDDFSGSAYVFVREGAIWTEQTKLTASDGAMYDQFGCSVAIDGVTAVIGACYADINDKYDAGSAYVFIRDGAIWTEQTKLTASDGESYDSFGYSVAIDGETAVVGAYHNTNANGFHAGSAYVFTRSDGAWAETFKLLASDGRAGDSLSYYQGVGVSGSTVVAGAPFHDPESATTNAGAAYVFVLVSSAGLTQLVETLVAEEVISAELQTSLLSKIANANKSAEKENICAAVNVLETLKYEIEAQTGKKISDESAVLLINYVDNLITLQLNRLPPGDSC